MALHMEFCGGLHCWHSRRTYATKLPVYDRLDAFGFFGLYYLVGGGGGTTIVSSDLIQHIRPQLTGRRVPRVLLG